MVVAYKVSFVTSALVRLFAHVKYFSMPNNLLDEPIVPEFMQERATVANLVPAVAEYLDNPVLCNEVKKRFDGILQTLRRGANQRAAQTVLSLVSDN
jgi:lipid-A-disaccharide synthase